MDLYDTIIVGGGIAGLYSAWLLPNDHKFAILEKYDVVGGRIQTYEDKHMSVEKGAGRFIEIDKPDALGNTEIDFNIAYNPPCAFTEFATCPLPPPQNRLKLSITAGEKNYGNH